MTFHWTKIFKLVPKKHSHHTHKMYILPNSQMKNFCPVKHSSKRVNRQAKKSRCLKCFINHNP